MAALSSCMIYSEMINAVKNKMIAQGKKDDILLMALDQFLFSVFSVVVPNTLILIAVRARARGHWRDHKRRRSRSECDGRARRSGQARGVPMLVARVGALVP